MNTIAMIGRAAMALVLVVLTMTGMAQAGAVVGGTYYADWENYGYRQQAEIREYHSCASLRDCSSFREGLTEQPPDTRTGVWPIPQQGEEEGKTTALTLFDAGMGIDGSNSCISCNFLSFFMIAMADFSQMIYDYFFQGFLLMIPLTLSIWLGYRAVRLMITGGEGGQDFLRNVVAKVALWTMVWLIATGANSHKHYLWEAVGPGFLSQTFNLSNDIRNFSLTSTNLANTSGGGDAVFCQGVSVPALSGGGLAAYAADSKYSFIQAAVEAACFTERAHILGIASGVALAFDSYGASGSFGWTDITKILMFLFTFLLKLLIGLAVVLAYTLSAVWLIFLVLDIVVRGLISAAFSPVLAALYLYQPTRSIATGAIRAMAGAIFTSISMAMVSVLAYVLITNTVLVYDATKAPVVTAYEEWDADEVPAFDDFNTNRIESMRNFIAYIGETDDSKTHIPMDFGTPWFWYMLFCGIAVFALGKKMVAMLEGLVGYQGASAMADSATQSIRSLTRPAMTGATLATGGMMAGAKLTTARMAGGALNGAATKSGMGLSMPDGGANILSKQGLAAAKAAAGQ